MGKVRCKQCKSYFSKEEVIKTRSGSFCDNDCMMEFIAKKRESDRLREISKAYVSTGRKKGKSSTDCENDLKLRKEAAKTACHKYIRERDKGEDCICCGKPLGDNYQAGHYLESGNNPKIRYDDDNIHAQRLDCNYFKGGDSGFYRVNLIKKIGIKRVERLESMKGGTVKRTPQDYKEIESSYKAKLIELKNKLNSVKSTD